MTAFSPTIFATVKRHIRRGLKDLDVSGNGRLAAFKNMLCPFQEEPDAVFGRRTSSDILGLKAVLLWPC